MSTETHNAAGEPTIEQRLAEAQPMAVLGARPELFMGAKGAGRLALYHHIARCPSGRSWPALYVGVWNRDVMTNQMRLAVFNLN